MSTRQITSTDVTTGTTSLLWKGAAITAVAALLSPRLHHVIHEDGTLWDFDSEARVLAPVVVVVALALFAAIGYPIWRTRGNGIAIGSLVVGILSVAAFVAFWISAPIILGGIAVTLGLGALGRPTASRPMAYVGIALGAIAFVGNVATWITNAF